MRITVYVVLHLEQMQISMMIEGLRVKLWLRAFTMPRIGVGDLISNPRGDEILKLLI